MRCKVNCLAWLCGILLVWGCGESSENPIDSDDSEEDTSDDDTGGDADGDADSDSDSDSDSDGDTDSETEDFICDEFDGVDLLIVIDNSHSMRQEQQILATALYTLVNTLVDPLEEDIDNENPVVTDLRVAVTTTDMGLQYGEDGITDGFPYDLDEKIWSGMDEDGDNGKFQGIQVDQIAVESGQIKCDEGGDQCPTADWKCEDDHCEAPEAETDGGVVDCPEWDTEALWAETTDEDENKQLTTEVACLAQQGTEGFGFEQQLQAGLRSLRRKSQKGFIKESHVLAVLVISDEEDCSIEDKGLFATDEFTDLEAGSLINMACNYPYENDENYLFDPAGYKEKLLKIKDNKDHSVFFAAIVGVPDKATLDGDDSPCEGSGHKIGDCLDHKKMEHKVEEFTDINGNKYNHFAPACTRDEGDEEVTNARPGRRFVKLAEAFGPAGYVYSICNADWSDAMQEIAKLLAECIIVE